MRLSRYTLRVDLEDGAYLLYNTYSGSLARIDREDDLILEKALARQPVDEAASEFLADLEDAKLVRNDDADEDLEIRQWYEAIRKNRGTLHITALTTNACNMGCAYCFEGDALKGTHMDPRTMDALVLWAERKLRELRPAAFTVRFFGGEPFVNPKGMLHLAREFRRMADQAGIPLYMLATTNGSLIPRELMAELSALGLKELWITLDGDEELHNQKRPLKNGKNSFQTIWKNLEEIKDLVRLVVRVNANPGEEKSLYQLLPKLEQSSFSSSITGMNIKPVQAFDPSLKDIDYRVTPELGESIVQWHGALERTKFPLPSPLDNEPCQIHRDPHFVVDPKGDLYPCESSIGKPSAIMGSIFLGGDVASEGSRKFFREYAPLDHPKCATCSYFPICGGGCRLASFSQDPTMEEDLHCPAALWDAAVPKAILNKFLQQKKEEEEGR